MYDPDINHYLGNDALPPLIFRIKDLHKRDVLEACGVINGDDDVNSRIAAFSSLPYD